MDKFGKVYLVGAGPGDPGLITKKGLELLQTCDAVIYDRLVSDRLLEAVKPACQKIYVGKSSGSHSLTQEEINRLLVESAAAHQIVVRLKGGDPFVFGRGGEEAQTLKEHGIAYEVVPGVTSAIAAAAYAGIPVTHRGSSQSFTVITGHTAEVDNGIPKQLRAYAKLEGTLVILMGITNLDKIREELLAGGRPPGTPAAVISDGTMPWQREVRGTLENIEEKVREAGITAPAIIVIGDVAELDLRADMKRALAGIRIGITGSEELRQKLGGQLNELGADIIVVSGLEIEEDADQTELAMALQSIIQYSWLVFTSSHAVTLFFQSFHKHNLDHRELSHIRFAVVGSSTAQTLKEYGFLADLIPQQYNAASLARELCGTVKREDRLLILRAKQGTQELTQIMEENGILFDDIKIYDVVNREQAPELLQRKLKDLDYLTFASASGVHSVFRNNGLIVGGLSEHTKAVCIGEATYHTLLSYGYKNTLIAGETSIRGMIETILEDCRL